MNSDQAVHNIMKVCIIMKIEEDGGLHKIKKIIEEDIKRGKGKSHIKMDKIDNDGMKISNNHRQREKKGKIENKKKETGTETETRESNY